MPNSPAHVPSAAPSVLSLLLLLLLLGPQFGCVAWCNCSLFAIWCHVLGATASCVGRWLPLCFQWLCNTQLPIVASVVVLTWVVVVSSVVVAVAIVAASFIRRVICRQHLHGNSAWLCLWPTWPTLCVYLSHICCKLLRLLCCRVPNGSVQFRTDNVERED